MIFLIPVVITLVFFCAEESFGVHDRINTMKRWIYWVGIFISVFFLYLAIRGLDLEHVWESIKTIDLMWFIPGILFYFTGVLVRAYRWSILLPREKHQKALHLLPSICIGYLGNNVFPARAGEFLRAYHLKEKQDIPFATSLASIIVERIFDGLVMVIFILIGLPGFLSQLENESISGLLNWILIGGAVVFLFAFLILLVSAIFPQKVKKVFDFIFLHILPRKAHEKYHTVLQRFFDGLAALKSPLQIVLVLALTGIVWIFETGLYWSVQQAFHFNLPFNNLLLLNGALNILSTIPSAPGYIGVFDAPGISILTAMGIASESAAAYILTLHVALWLPITIVGFAYFFKEGLQWSTIKTKNQ